MVQYRSPEEFAASDLDEKIDVYSFGNNLYGLVSDNQRSDRELPFRKGFLTSQMFHSDTPIAHWALGVLHKRR
jgi:hypothetical protein